MQLYRVVFIFFVNLNWLANHSESRIQPPLRIIKVNTNKCCTTCKNPQRKYFSVDREHGFCGESCIRTSRFPLFRIFEPTLTGDWITNVPCSDHGYSKYNSTVSHGLWPLSVKLDIYSPPFAPETKRIIYSN